MEDELFNSKMLITPWPRRLWQKDVMFIDGMENESERFFNLRKVTSFRLDKAFRYKKNPKYSIKSGTISAKELPFFIDAMTDLQEKMIILGYKDYEEACAEVFEITGV